MEMTVGTVLETIPTSRIWKMERKVTREREGKTPLNKGSFYTGNLTIKRP